MYMSGSVEEDVDAPVSSDGHAIGRRFRIALKHCREARAQPRPSSDTFSPYAERAHSHRPAVSLSLTAQVRYGGLAFARSAVGAPD